MNANGNQDAKVTGSCHCGAVRFALADRPTHLTFCNCSICRRYATLWAHGTTNRISVEAGRDATLQYIWGDKRLAFHTCKTCGCTTHWTSLEAGNDRMAVNCRLADPEVVAEIRVRHLDGADTWEYLD